MNSKFQSSRLSILPLLLFTLALTITVQGQEPPPSGTDRKQLLAVAREIMATARYCALITIGASGNINARTMDPFPPTEDMVIWFGTNPRSRKVREIRRNRRVTLYYVDPVAQAYVTIQGTARLVNDPAEKVRRWKDEWKAFYPDRQQSYLLIAVTPKKLEVVNVKAGLTGDPITWDPPFVRFGK